MFTTAKDDDMVECPYNKYHQMTRKRLIPHLIKCRLSFPDAELIKCPFNASHLIPEPEFTHHVSNCKDRAIIHQYKYNTLPVKLDEEDRNQVVIDCDENWDDTDAVDYDPKKYVAQANVIRSHIGDLPSVRKEFRKNERKRLGDEDSSDEESFRKKVYKDMDFKKREDNGFDGRGPSSSSRSNSQSKTSYRESLKEFSRQRGRDEDFPAKIIKIESSDSDDEEDSKGKRENSSPEARREEEDLFKRRDEEDTRRQRRDSSLERRREDHMFKSRNEDDSRRERRDSSPDRGREKDDGKYPLDDDPYYRPQSTRTGFLGMSRGSRRKYH